ncbi:MAG TPA: molybdopterin dinucleotide binding domain-containing protein [Thermoleophilia bacterium]|nr:molybdopterin dinucleotide binding domain-containing protein [Thermoleophilia bacterium]
MSDRLTLITGRTRKQAIGMHKGKASAEYLAATALVEMNPDDMTRLEVSDGGQVLLRTADGEVELTAHAGTVPAGLVFVPMGTMANKLVGTETLGTGMPCFKGLQVDVTPLPGEEVST